MTRSNARPDHWPFRNDDYYSWHLILVDQQTATTRDLININEPDEAFWLCYAALGGAMEKPLPSVRRTMAALGTEPPLSYLMWALWHPETPFGLGCRPKLLYPGRPPRGKRPMVVLFQGWLYERGPTGDLTLTGDAINWPASDDFYEAVQVMRRSH